MSDLDLARNIMAELATKTAKVVKGWRWAKGVVLFPEIRCPYCEQGVQSTAIWKHTDHSLIGAVIPVAGVTPRLGKVEHPHARQEWTGQICFGNHGVTNAHHALFGALNPGAAYIEHVVPFLKGDLMGNHTCDEVPDDGGRICIECDKALKADDVYAFDGDPYCENCFNDVAFYCYICGDATDINAAWLDPAGLKCCETCWTENYFRCVTCGEVKHVDDAYYNTDGDDYCYECWREKFFNCGVCGNVHALEDQAEDTNYCKECDATVCAACGEHYSKQYVWQVTEHAHLKCPDCELLYIPQEGETHKCA